MYAALGFILYMLALAFPFKGWWTPANTTPFDACVDMQAGLGVEGDPAQPTPAGWESFGTLGKLGILRVEGGSYWVRC